MTGAATAMLKEPYPDLDLDLERWQKLCGLVSFRSAWPWPTRVTADADRDCVRLRVAIDGPDVITGAPQTVHHVEHMYRSDRIEDEDAVRIIRAFVFRCFEHEFDECLLFAGHQVRDPHVKERR